MDRHQHCNPSRANRRPTAGPRTARVHTRSALLLVAATTAAAVTAAGADFVGYYDIANWDFFAQDDGWLDDSGAPAEVTIYGTDSGGSYSYTTLTIEAQFDCTFAFDWEYGTFDGPPYDNAGYIVGGTYYYLIGDAEYSGSGHVEVDVSAGTTIGFYVRSEDGCCGAGWLLISEFLSGCDLDVDTNRDKTIDDADEEDEDKWSKERGALFLVNCDDDDKKDGKPDGLEFDVKHKPITPEDKVINGAADVDDITPFVVRAVGKKKGKKWFLKSDIDQITKVHIFEARMAGKESIWGGPGEEKDEIQITALVKEDEDVEFGLEGLYFRYVGDCAGDMWFAGYVDLTLEERDAATGKVLSSDAVKLKVAPLILLPNTQTAERFFAMRAKPVHYCQDLLSALSTPNPGQKWPVSIYQTDYQFAQDHAEIGYTATPWGSMHVAGRIAYEKKKVLIDAQWPHDWMAHKKAKNFGVYRFPADETVGSGDFGGNIELLPPTKKHPLGQIVQGNTRSMKTLMFLMSQECQPIIQPEPETDWLAIGHVDEIMNFYAVKPHQKVIVAWPDRAKELIDPLPGHAVFFASGETSHGTVTGSTPNTLADAGRDFTLGKWTYVRIYDSSPADLTGDGVVGAPDLFALIAAWGRCGDHDEDLTGDHVVDVLDLLEVLTNWGTCSKDDEGQVAHIAKRHNGFIEIDKVWQYDLIPASCPILMDPVKTWLQNPQKGSRYVLVEPGRGKEPFVMWEELDDEEDQEQDSMGPAPAQLDVAAAQKARVPAFVTVRELKKKDLRELNDRAQKKIDAAVSVIKEAMDGQAIEFVKVPVIFTAKHKLQEGEIVSRSAWALTPNLANFVTHDGVIARFPKPFAPKVNDMDVFEQDVKKMVPGAKFVDDWFGYHNGGGEIHCGSNVRRKIFDFNWWEELP